MSFNNIKKENVMMMMSMLYRGLPTSLLFGLSAFVQFYAIRAFA